MSLLRSEDLWAALPMPAILIDGDDRAVAVNSAAEEFLNLSARSLTGQPMFDKLAIDAPMEAAFAEIRADRSAFSLNDVDVGTGERAPVRCHLHAGPVPDAPGMILLLISPRDVAGRLAHSRRGQSSAKSAIGMAEMLAHEIKNPLAGISGAAQLLAMELDAQGRELTDLIVEETRRVVRLLERVEQFGNLNPPDLKPVNIHDVLTQARKSALLGFAHEMQIVEDYDPSLPETMGDADQLVQVLLNLLKNATQASEAGRGTIRLKTFYDHALRIRRRDGSGQVLPLQIEVIDDGPGIPPDLAADVFDPFVSGRENGTGLGLALVSKIIGDHSGWISADSHPGRTVFRISLPAAPRGAKPEVL